MLLAQGELFPSKVRISAEAVQTIRSQNPWWSGSAMPVLPAFRRHLAGAMQRKLASRLAPIIVVRGPRQVGKSTAQMQVLSDLLRDGHPPANILHVQFDDLPRFGELREPILRIVEWYEESVLGMTLNDAAARGAGTYLFFDEVQNLDDWAPQLKSLVDHKTTRVVVTGSSALRIERGGRDSLAGRIATVEAGVLSLTEIGSLHKLGDVRPLFSGNGTGVLTEPDWWTSLAAQGRADPRFRDEAFTLFSERGGYPFLHMLPRFDWPEAAAQLNETVVKRVIRHDLRTAEKPGAKRDAALLEHLFLLGCRYAGQAPGTAIFAREVARSLNGNVGTQRIRHYLEFLADTLLLHLIPPLEIRLKRQKGNSKVCLADHALRAAWLQEVVPLDPEGLLREPHLTTLAGHLAESVVGSALSAVLPGGVSHWPATGDNPEIDFIATVGVKRVPIEVKYQKRIDPARDTESLRAFIEKSVNNATFGVLVTQTDTPVVVDPRIVCLPLSSFLLMS